jgi:hypothetical protein
MIATLLQFLELSALLALAAIVAAGGIVWSHQNEQRELNAKLKALKPITPEDSETRRVILGALEKEIGQ